MSLLASMCALDQRYHEGRGAYGHDVQYLLALSVVQLSRNQSGLVVVEG